MKYLFKLLMAITFVLFAVNYLVAQNTNLNYYSHVVQQDQYYDSIRSTLPDSVKIPGWRQYQRWKDFWQNRVYNDISGNGNFDKYVQASIDANTLKESYTNTGSFNWSLIGPTNLTTHNRGIIVSLWVDPDNADVIYAGSNTGGLFRTVNGGSNWVNATDNISLPAIGINSIAVHPTNKDIKYIAASVCHHEYLATGQPVYIFKTTDNCNTWSTVLSLPPAAGSIITKIIMDTQDPETLYATINGKVYRTMDGGVSWSVIFDLLSYAPDNYWKNKMKFLTDIEIKTDDPNTIIISSNGVEDNEYPGLTSEMWYTNNSKASSSNVYWYRITDGLPIFTDRIGLAVDYSNPNRIYILYKDLMVNIKRWSFNTQQFETIFSVPSSSSYNCYSGIGYWKNCIEVSPTNPNIIYFGGDLLQIVDLTQLNNGQNGRIYWTNIKALPHADFHVDQRDFKTAVINGNTHLFIANDGGVSKYQFENNSHNLQSLNGSGLDNIQYYGITQGLPEINHHIGGTQDNGVIGNAEDGIWRATGRGDAYEVVTSKTSSNLCFSTFNGGYKRVKKSVDFGKSFVDFSNGLPFGNRDLGLNDRPFILSPHDNQTLYIGYHELYKRDIINGSSWIKCTDFHSMPGLEINDLMIAIGMSKASQNTIYAGFALPTWSNDPKYAKLFVTHNGGQTWTDITNGIRSIVQWVGITDIYVSPENAQKVWISFGNYSDFSSPTANRVLYSENGGQSWTDITYNLPNLPVNCLSGINIDLENRILLGNDIGVFMLDAGNSTWNFISNGVPNSLIYDIEVNQSARKILVATYGRSMWGADLPCEFSNNEIEITGQISLSADYIINSNIRIKSGGFLTVKGCLDFSTNSKLIIERGGKLIVDGGKLTTSCNTPWLGIEVWGNSQLAHVPNSNQGWVKVINGGVIENAICAIKAYRPTDEDSGTPMQNYTGGIVQANDAIFRNNRTAVHIPGYSFNNLSYFNNVSFETTDALVDNTNPDYFVKLESVTGVSFKGCSFENKRTVGSIPVENRGSGIYSINSGVRLESLCTNTSINPCPEVNIQRSLVKNLYYGVYALSTGPEKLTIVNRTDFVTNFRGLYLSAMNYATLTQNYIHSWEEQVTQNHQTYGFYLDRCTGYQIESNEFNSENASQRGIGLIINKSGIENNQVYNNIFKNLRTAAQAQDNNRGKNNQGLCYRCNDFTNNNYDIKVAVSNFPIDPYFDGIASRQGSLLTNGTYGPAANAFTYDQQAGYNIHNSGNFFTYYKHANGNGYKITPFPNAGSGGLTVFTVPNTSYIKSVDCPSSLNSGGSSEEKALMETAEASLESKIVQLESLVDGGNTPVLDASVAGSTSSTASVVYQDLLSKSPYLSDTVLSTSIQKEDVLISPMIRDVLVANPQAAKTDQLLDLLELRSEPLPDYMWAEIMQGENTSGAKENLEAEYVFWAQKRYRHWSNLNRNYILDSEISSSCDSLVILLETDNTVAAKQQLALLYVMKQNGMMANSVLANIPGQFQLDAQQLAENQKLINYVNTLLSVEQSSPYRLVPDASHIPVLEALMNTESGQATVYSRNLLVHANETIYQEPILGDDLLKSSRKKRGGNNNSLLTRQELLQVYPNPSSDFFVIKTSFTEEKGRVQLISQQGVVVSEHELNSGQNQLVVHTQKLAKGSYLIALIVKEKRIATCKINIQ